MNSDKVSASLAVADSTSLFEDALAEMKLAGLLYAEAIDFEFGGGDTPFDFGDPPVEPGDLFVPRAQLLGRNDRPVAGPGCPRTRSRGGTGSPGSP